MSIEKALADLTAAVQANTEAHQKLEKAAIASMKQKAAAAKAPADDDEDDEPAPKPAARKTAAKPAAEKKAPAKKPASRAKKPAEPKLSATVERDEVSNAARNWMDTDDEAVRDERKAQFKAALNHLGAKKMGDVDDDDLPRLMAYIAYWSADLEVDFEALDEKIAEMAEDDDLV